MRTHGHREGASLTGSVGGPREDSKGVGRSGRDVMGRNARCR